MNYNSFLKFIGDAKKLSEVNDPLFSKHDLGTVYTFLNIATTTRASYIIALFYIEKLEKTLNTSKRSKKPTST